MSSKTEETAMDVTTLTTEYMKLKKSNEQMEANVLEIQQLFRAWFCPKCVKIKQFTELPKKKFSCEGCGEEMIPYVVHDYRQLKSENEKLKKEAETMTTDRNRYATIIKGTSAILKDMGFNPGEDDLPDFIKKQFEYMLKLEKAMAEKVE